MIQTEIDGIPVSYPDEMQEEEAAQYVQRGKQKYGKALKGIEIGISDDEQDALLHYDVSPVKFQRLRRVTGYLVGTLDRWNNAKRAEEHDRVKHA